MWLRFGDNYDAVASANSTTAGSSSKMVRPASTANTFSARGENRFERLQPDGRHVEPHVLLGLPL